MAEAQGSLLPRNLLDLEGWAVQAEKMEETEGSIGKRDPVSWPRGQKGHWGSGCGAQRRGKGGTQYPGVPAKETDVPPSWCMFLQDVAFSSSSEADVVTDYRNI